MCQSFKDGLLRYETVLTAQIFLRIFDHTTPLSKYFQTEMMNILSAHRMVIATHESIARDFISVRAAADTFVKWTNESIEQRKEGTNIEVDAALPQKRAKEKKSRVGEMAENESLIDAESAYEVNVLNIILDTAIEAILFSSQQCTPRPQ